MSDIQFHHGDCRDVMALWPANSVDAFVTDTPYGLTQNKKGGSGSKSLNLNSPAGRSRITTGGFMNAKWDASVPGVDYWTECLRVAKPGAYLLAFGGGRTHHRLMVAIEDAGWEIVDVILWLYGQGMNKVGYIKHPETKEAMFPFAGAMKPSWEPVVVARKPMTQSIGANLLEWGTGALNIDACRIPIDATIDDPRLGGNGSWGTEKMAKNVYEGGYAGDRVASSPLGRWPSNIVHDGSKEVVSGFPVTTSGTGAVKRATAKGHKANAYGVESRPEGTPNIEYGDTGNASRFFYQAKASGLDRWFYCRDCAGAYLDSEREQHGHDHTDEAGKQTWDHVVSHPTVKPTSLMRWLVKLVTPPGGILVDPFVGSGSTLVAAEIEGFNAIGIDIDSEYLAIAKRRVASVQLPLLALANG